MEFTPQNDDDDLIAFLLGQMTYIKAFIKTFPRVLFLVNPHYPLVALTRT